MLEYALKYQLTTHRMLLLRDTVHEQSPCSILCCVVSSRHSILNNQRANCLSYGNVYFFFLGATARGGLWPPFLFRGFCNNDCFTGWGCKPHAQPPAILEDQCFLLGLSPLAGWSQFESVRNSLFALAWLSRKNVSQESLRGRACIGLGRNRWHYPSFDSTHPPSKIFGLGARHDHFEMCTTYEKTGIMCERDVKCIYTHEESNNVTSTLTEAFKQSIVPNCKL
jgi:hypothetical protein